METDDKEYAAHLDRISPRLHEKGCACEECAPEGPVRDHGKIPMDRTLAILDKQDQQREINDRDRECGRDEDRE